MSDLAIQCTGIGKRYAIGERAPYRTLRESVMSLLRSPGQRLRKRAARKHNDEDFLWALHDVSFEVKDGEVLGVIGRNGAGKSTLLKILSRITEPTAGRGFIQGRVGSLLEVGTGFHPELTGRENVFLNGAVLGMRRAEMMRKFDEIVAFAELERFIDTPVKRYSSGMYMRLAFAVAAHLEPEILLVDEVLAVGDAAFQKKCLKKMETVGQQGRTVLFVSHNMAAVTRLCGRVILLDGGTIVADGDSHRVVRHYLDSGLGSTAIREWPDPRHAPGDEVVRLRAVRVRNHLGEISETHDVRHPLGIEMEFDVLEGGRQLLPMLRFVNSDGVCAFTTSDLDPAWKGRARPAGLFVSTAWIPPHLLCDGVITIEAAIVGIPRGHQHCAVPDAVALQMVDAAEGDSARGDYAGPMPGVVRPLLRWTNDYRPAGAATTASVAHRLS